jgi:drug/metabolite transporter superfamily protein YnfA
MLLSTLLFIAFALLAAGGCYLVCAHQRGRRAGLTGALATLALFAALYWGLLGLLRSGGF